MIPFAPTVPFKSDVADAPAYWSVDILWIVHARGDCHVFNYYTPAGFEQAIIGCARPAGTRTLPPKGLDAHDSPKVVRFFNNDWIAPADAPWAIQKGP